MMRTSGKEKRDNCRDCTCQHGSTWRVASLCRRKGSVRPPEWSETGRADSALITHLPTCGELQLKLYYGADRRRRIARERVPIRRLSRRQACRK